jgi:hypothetical protein
MKPQKFFRPVLVWALLVTLSRAVGVSTPLTASAQGNVYYVDQNHPQASDSNAGTEDWPWVTIQHAADVAVAGSPSHAAPGDEVVPGQMRADATFEHIGVLWWVEGDENLDSAMSLEFRQQGESDWRSGALAMRAYPTIYVHDGPLGLNYWAASALFLEPGQTYELRLTLTDPDGGGETRTVTAATRTEPQPDPAGRRLYVIPGSGGACGERGRTSDGSAGDPFRGLQAAADAAQPGDVLHVAAGIYSPFQLLASGDEGHPITFTGPGDGTAIVDGAGTSRGIITLGEWNQTISHVIIEGFTIPPVWDTVADDFESGTLDTWETVSAGDLSLVTGGGHNGSTGLSVAVGQSERYVYQTDVAKAEEGYLTFWFDPNGVSIPDPFTWWPPGNSICVASVVGPSWWPPLVSLYVRSPEGEGYEGYLAWPTTDGRHYDYESGAFDLGDGWQKITLGYRMDEWVAVWVDDELVRYDDNTVVHEDPYGEIIEIGKTNENSDITPSGAMRFDEVAFQVPRVDDLWVDAASGDDGNDGLTATTAFRTIQKAADRSLPRDRVARDERQRHRARPLHRRRWPWHGGHPGL